jgi:porin
MGTKTVFGIRRYYPIERIAATGAETVRMILQRDHIPGSFDAEARCDYRGCAASRQKILGFAKSHRRPAVMIFGRASLAALLIIFAGAFGLRGEPLTAQEEGLFEREKLTGDWGGMRKRLQNAGIDFGLTGVAETLSNPVGGIKQSTIYQGLLTASLNLDLEKLADWRGASFFTDAYQISGRGLSRIALDNLLTVSSIEALATTRLHDLWLQQGFLGGQASLRVGQIALDDEFYTSRYSTVFINNTFGCPEILSGDLPSGGPCYPFATPGARLWAMPITSLTLSAAAFNGDPAPPGPGDPQVRNSSGTNFLIGEGGFLTVAEVTYSFDEEPISSSRLSDVKFGGWYHTANFPDLRLDSLGRSLADPTSNGVAAERKGNFGLYIVLDKMLWRRPETASEGLAAFLRVGGAPPDRNLISFEVDGGLTYKGVFPGRDDDLLGVAASYARIGNAARHLDRDEILFTGTAGTIRDYEAVLEITYQSRVAPWWILQPDLQLLFHPGGHIAAPFPAPATRPIPNALVVGLRSSITF